ncbi:MAG: GNAT family N-acetyltransferase [Candidatus Omnitrophica bacterium]|nr:GNAT family N-acetyltransferase [Candidatus Omnitrophota bacterium]MDD5671250.1 GNAT family N-acetyltransferase [Candidatus Omnitrophota bacterium]
MSIEICTVESARDIDQFVRFAWEVYRGNPLWVPPVVRDTKNFLAGKSLFFRHCRHQLFMAKEDSKIVATVAAFYDQNLVERWGKRVGLLGYFEALPDRDKTLKALFEQAEVYLRQQGAETVWAPINGGIANPSGVLANAYNQTPVFLMMYNPSYYHQYFRRLGYYPVKELIAYTMDLMDGRLKRKIGFIMKRAKRSEVRIRSFDRKHFREDSDKLSQAYSVTFKSHWGYAPQTDDEMYEILYPMRLALDPDLILFAEHKGKVIGFTLTVPDYNPIIRKLNGNLDLLNGLTFLRNKRNIREGRLIAIGVIPEWRGKGVSPLLMASVYDAMIRKGYIKCEYSWVFRENISSQNVAQKFDSETYKHYYVYERNIAAEDKQRFIR